LHQLGLRLEHQLERERLAHLLRVGLRDFDEGVVEFEQVEYVGLAEHLVLRAAFGQRSGCARDLELFDLDVDFELG